MDHSRQRRVVRESRQQFGDLRTVGDITLGDRDLGSKLGQFPFQLRGPGGRPAGPAGQHQMRGPLRRQPPRDVTAEGARTARHQHGSARRPAAVRVDVGDQASGQTAQVHPGRPNRDLILPPVRAEQVDQATAGLLVDRAGRLVGGQGWNVHDSAPPSGLLQADGPAQSPHGRLDRVIQHVARDRGHRVDGHEPDRCVDVGVLERLYEDDRQRESRGHGVGRREHPLVEAEPGQHAPHRFTVGTRRHDPLSESSPIQAGATRAVVIDDDRVDPGPPRGERLPCRVHPCVGAERRRYHGQP